MILLLLSNTFVDERVTTWHSPLLEAALVDTVYADKRVSQWHAPLSFVAALGEPVAPAEGGAAKFDNLSRGMLVVDEEAWEDEGVILPLTLDSFP